MARPDYRRSLAQVQDDLLLLGSMVDKAVAHSLTALRERDMDLARRTVREDDLIDTKRVEIEEQCAELIATQAPVASDLRMLLAIFAVVSELERIGDYAEGIAKIAIMMGQEPPLKPLIDIPLMADRGRAMLREALDSLVRRDLALARSVRQQDDEVDRLYDRVYRDLLVFMINDPGTVERATHLLWVAHDLERIADRATNVAERAIFLVTGDIRAR
jgi:phosphate transport system protein